jgi:hypothetical protein
LFTVYTTNLAVKTGVWAECIYVNLKKRVYMFRTILGIATAPLNCIVVVCNGDTTCFLWDGKSLFKYCLEERFALKICSVYLSKNFIILSGMRGVRD